jgi:hypothetical protein
MHPSPQLPPIGPWRGLPPLFRHDDPPQNPDPPDPDGPGCSLAVLLATFFLFLFSRCR